MVEAANKCGNHPYLSLDFFCQSCHRLCCGICMKAEHNEHIKEVQHLSELGETIKGELREENAFWFGDRDIKRNMYS